MFNRAPFTKKAALGVAVVAVGFTASLAVSSNQPAQAIQLKIVFDNVKTSNSDGNQDVTGSIIYDTVSNNYSNWNISTIAGSQLTSAFNYTTTNSYSPSTFGVPGFGGSIANSAQQFSLAKNGSTSSDFRTIFFKFNSPITAVGIYSLTTSGPGNNSSFEINGSEEDYQVRRFLGGSTVTVTYVPEPVTILGTLLAGGIGVALKKKKDSSVESC